MLRKLPGEHVVRVAAELDDVDNYIFTQVQVAAILLDKARGATMEHRYRRAKACLSTVFVHFRPKRAGQPCSILAAAKCQQRRESLTSQWHLNYLVVVEKPPMVEQP